MFSLSNAAPARAWMAHPNVLRYLNLSGPAYGRGPTEKEKNLCKRNPKQPFINGEYVEATMAPDRGVLFRATGGSDRDRLIAATPESWTRPSPAARKAQRAWAAMSGTETGADPAPCSRHYARTQPRSVYPRTYDNGAKTLSGNLWSRMPPVAGRALNIRRLARIADGRAYPAGRKTGLYPTAELWGLCRHRRRELSTQIACWKGRNRRLALLGKLIIFKPSRTTPLCALKVAKFWSGRPARRSVQRCAKHGRRGRVLVTTRRRQSIADRLCADGRRLCPPPPKASKHVHDGLGGNPDDRGSEDADIENSHQRRRSWVTSTLRSKSCSERHRVFVHRTCQEAFLKRLG